MRRRRERYRDREIDLGRPDVGGLEVIENDPSAEPPAPPPVRLLPDFPPLPEISYAEPEDDHTGTKGIWRAIEHL